MPCHTEPMLRRTNTQSHLCCELAANDFEKQTHVVVVVQTTQPHTHMHIHRLLFAQRIKMATRGKQWIGGDRRACTHMYTRWTDLMYTHTHTHADCRLLVGHSTGAEIFVHIHFICNKIRRNLTEQTHTHTQRLLILKSCLNEAPHPVVLDTSGGHRVTCAHPKKLSRAFRYFDSTHNLTHRPTKTARARIP